MATTSTKAATSDEKTMTKPPPAQTAPPEPATATASAAPEAKTGAARPAGAALQAAHREGLGQMAWMGAATYHALAALGQEAMEFVSERIAEDMRTQHALLHCRDLQEAQRVQIEFVQKALVQYSAQTGKMVELGTGVMTAAMPKRGKDSGPV